MPAYGILAGGGIAGSASYAATKLGQCIVKNKKGKLMVSAIGNILEQSSQDPNHDLLKKQIRMHARSLMKQIASLKVIVRMAITCVSVMIDCSLGVVGSTA